MLTKNREERKQRYLQRMKLEKRSVVDSVYSGTHEEVVEAVRSTNLQFAWNYKWTPYILRKDIVATAHPPYTQMQITLPAGTKGWYYCSIDLVYDKYVRVDDMDLPAEGAKVIKILKYHSWVCLAKYEGKTILVESFSKTETHNSH